MLEITRRTHFSTPVVYRRTILVSFLALILLLFVSFLISLFFSSLFICFIFFSLLLLIHSPSWFLFLALVLSGTLRAKQSNKE